LWIGATADPLWNPLRSFGKDIASAGPLRTNGSCANVSHTASVRIS
jgi:hypothetical protein